MVSMFSRKVADGVQGGQLPKKQLAAIVVIHIYSYS